MTNEEFEKKMEFIVEQQAQFAVDIQRLQEAQTQTEHVVNRLAAVTLEGFKDVNAKIDALVDSHMRLSEVTHEGFKDVNNKISALVDSQMRLTEAQARTDENLKRTDEALRNLMAVAERYFSEGRNGQSKD